MFQRVLNCFLRKYVIYSWEMQLFISKGRLSIRRGSDFHFLATHRATSLTLRCAFFSEPQIQIIFPSRHNSESTGTPEILVTVEEVMPERQPTSSVSSDWQVALTCLGDSGPEVSIPPPSGRLSLLAVSLRALGLLLFLPSAPGWRADGLQGAAWGGWGAEAAPLWVA